MLYWTITLGSNSDRGLEIRFWKPEVLVDVETFKQQIEENLNNASDFLIGEYVRLLCGKIHNVDDIVHKNDSLLAIIQNEKLVRNQWNKLLRYPSLSELSNEIKSVVYRVTLIANSEASSEMSS